MSDPRLTPANGRVAALGLEGKLRARRFVAGEARSVMRPVADLWADEGGNRRQRQLLLGEAFTVLEVQSGMAFGQAQKDGYVGYLENAALGPAISPTHAVSALSSHLYAAPDLKSRDLGWLSFGSRLAIVGQSGTHMETADGQFVPAQHLRALDAPLADPAAVAEQFLGVPYLWGGNSSRGIDCSGLVQAALVACDMACPGDSDQQETALGHALAPEEPTKRGDLFFWRGHVAMALDGEWLIHANATDMAVARERISQAIQRIELQGEGPLTSRRRL